MFKKGYIIVHVAINNGTLSAVLSCLRRGSFVRLGRDAPYPKSSWICLAVLALFSGFLKQQGRITSTNLFEFYASSMSSNSNRSVAPHARLIPSAEDIIESIAKF